MQDLAAQCAAVVMQQAEVMEAAVPQSQEKLQALPASLSNLHAYLVFVAARIDRLADGVALQRDAFLAKRWQVGPGPLSAIQQHVHDLLRSGGVSALRSRWQYRVGMHTLKLSLSLFLSCCDV